MEIEKHMVMCINTETGDQKPFPKLEVAKPYFLTTGFRAMTNDEEALYVKNATAEAVENKTTAPTGKLPVSEKGIEDFKKFVNKQTGIELLQQSKDRFTDEWQTLLIDARIAELTPAKTEEKVETKTPTK